LNVEDEDEMTVAAIGFRHKPWSFRTVGLDAAFNQCRRTESSVETDDASGRETSSA